jgi:hypothetical protein
MSNFSQRPVNNFVKGLITEAGELSFPENASVDELNCTLFRDGSRRRRKGIRFEADNTNSTFDVDEDTFLNFGEWSNVNNDSQKNYLVVQKDHTLYFYDKGVVPFSSAEKANSVDLTPFSVSGLVNLSTTPCSFASILGFLIVVNPYLDPIFIRENDDGTFTAETIDFRIRDFVWQGNQTEYSSKGLLGSLTQARIYDTRNTGWNNSGVNVGEDALNAYVAAFTSYPPLTIPWYSSKNASGNFDTGDFNKLYSGSSLIGNGHYILSLFNQRRSTVSGVSGIDDVILDSRFTSVETFAGRLWYAGVTESEQASNVYFSQVLTSIDLAGELLQANDPTSEYVSDVLDNDGGVINIPGATNIRRLYAFRNSIFVFAENGVWQITGLDNVFKPSGYSVSKISEIGILSSTSFTSAEGVPFWWSRFGIHTLSFDEFGNASEQNLSISTIQTFWDEIEPSAKSSAVAAYDKVNKKIYWLYKSNGETTNNKLNRVLVLDVILQAFYPWEFSDSETDTDYVVGVQFFENYTNFEDTDNVVVNSDTVLVGAETVVNTTFVSRTSNDLSVIFFARDTSENKMTMAEAESNTYLDWGDANYTSFAETGYDFGGDIVLKMTAPYVVFYLRETELGWKGNEDDGFTPINDSSLLVSTYWDFKKQATTQQQAYKRRLFTVDPADLSWNSESSMVSRRLKIRGRGRSFRIRLESEQGKDFIYLGHGLIIDTARSF